jgi:Helix-turn-helix domain
MAKRESPKTKRLAAPTTNPEFKTIKLDFTNNSAFNQCLKLLDYLLEYGRITTKQAQEKLGIYYPPARIFTLRQNGYLIHLDWVIWVDEHGIKHRIGRYTLMQKQPLELIKNDEVMQ